MAGKMKMAMTPRTTAALNDIASGLQMIEHAIDALGMEAEKAAFERYARRVSEAAARRVTVAAMREHAGQRNGREQMTLQEWREFTY